MSEPGEAVGRFPAVRAMREAVSALCGRVQRAAGGAARFKVIVLFAGVMALDTADIGTVGAVAPQLERSLHISNTQVGLIAAVSALAGAVGTLPVGLLTDRTHRINLLSASIVLWSAALIGCAVAPSFGVLVASRVALGAVTATSGPTVASLIGDFFPARERARIWGLILTGELFGSGIGLVVSGDLAGALSWRWGFAWLALPGMALAVAIWKMLVEPARGGQSQLEPGDEELVDRGEVRSRRGETRSRRAGQRPDELVERDQELAQEIASRQRREPHRDLVLHEDPVDMPLWRAVRYVLRVRTNVILIIASTLGYLFFSGVQTFAVVLMRSRYHLGQSTATSLLVLIGLGALVGVVFGGRTADRLLSKGRITARVLVAAIGYISAAILFVPALASPALFVSVPFFILAAAGLAAPDPTLNSARLDIMHPRLWGRAEGVRTVLWMTAKAVGPLLFGLVSGALGGPQANGGVRATSAANGTALAHAFLIMLVPLAIAGVSLLWARRTYPRDVATAAASIAATANASGKQGS
jgi:predicted MFS family arabinose efflux permease